MSVVHKGCSAVSSTMGVVKNKKVKYLTTNEKARDWENANIAKIVRDHLYPVAKIIFNSKEELEYNGNICNLIMDKISWDPEYDRLSEKDQDEHRKERWAVWSTQISKGLDGKRHNQKAGLRKAFYGMCNDGTVMSKLCVCTIRVGTNCVYFPY